MSSTFYELLRVSPITNLYTCKGPGPYASYHAHRRSAAVTPGRAVPLIEVSRKSIRVLLLIPGTRHIALE